MIHSPIYTYNVFVVIIQYIVWYSETETVCNIVFMCCLLFELLYTRTYTVYWYCLSLLIVSIFIVFST